MMPTQLTILFMVLYVLESLTIIVQSGLIVAVLGREWVQVKKMSPVDTILISLGFCRFLLQWSSVVYNFCSYFNPKPVFWYISIFWEFTNALTFWLTSLLAVVFCVKVSSITHPVFLWLRWRILRSVPWLLLGSLLISCASIIFSATRLHLENEILSMRHVHRNNTGLETLETLVKHFLIVEQVVVLSVPFLLFLASTIFLISSLSQHLGRIQHRSGGHGSSSRNAHLTALRSLATSLVVFTFYFLTIIISFKESLSEQKPWSWAWETIIYAIVSIHSTSLLLSNPKLKKVLKVRCWGLEAV